MRPLESICIDYKENREEEGFPGWLGLNVTSASSVVLHSQPWQGLTVSVRTPFSQTLLYLLFFSLLWSNTRQEATSGRKGLFWLTVWEWTVVHHRWGGMAAGAWNYTVVRKLRVDRKCVGEMINPKTCPQHLIFKGMPFFFFLEILSFRNWNFAQPYKQVNNMLWDHLKLCTQSLSLLCTQLI